MKTIVNWNDIENIVIMQLTNYFNQIGFLDIDKADKTIRAYNAACIVAPLKDMGVIYDYSINVKAHADNPDWLVASFDYKLNDTVEFIHTEFFIAGSYPKTTKVNMEVD